MCGQVWGSILTQSSCTALQSAVCSLMWAWLCLLVAPSSSPLDSNLLVPPRSGVQVNPSPEFQGCVLILAVNSHYYGGRGYVMM